MGREEDGFGSVGSVSTQILRLDLPPGGYILDSGRSLAQIDVAYEAYGRLSPTRDNVVYICHALSGHAHAAGIHASPDPDDPAAWWDNMIGPGKGIDTDHYYVVCANILGGCKGTTGPGSLDPATGQPYGSTFPSVSVGDIVGVHRMLLRQLGITRVASAVGGSFGGMQVLEWAIRFPDMLERCVIIATADSLSAQALAFDIVARKAIMFDPDWQGGDYYTGGRRPSKGLSLARSLGHITYLSPEMMTRKFGREKWSTDAGRAPDGAEPRGHKFQVETYLEHQGDKFTRRFDANSYLHITSAMDEYDVAARYGGLEQAFSHIQAKVLVVAVSSDWLFPPEQSMEIASAMLRVDKPVSYCLLNAPHGHDAFLVDVEHLAEVIHAFLPWVGPPPVATVTETGGAARRAARRAARANGQEAASREFASISRMVRPGSRILDLGCGGGHLLSLLAQHQQAQGVGVEIDIRHVIDVLEAGHDIFQADLDGGLAMIPDGKYDYAILSATLQVVRKPRVALNELLRVAKEGIVSFPNFGFWRHQWALLRSGRMPKGHALPFEWYETPNIHLFTYLDFLALCRRDGIQILETVFPSSGFLGKLLVRCGAKNLGAESALVRITKQSAGAKG